MAHYNEICVSLDIETTGLSKERDEIIEIGALKFRGEEIISSFKTFIKPGIPVPYEVLSLTGIKVSELRKAPTFEKIEKRLKKFIGKYPIVGHNIDFDLDFLESKGLPIKNPRYDTWHLSLILLPNLSVYSLESLARVLEIEQLESHRALADAITAKDLFLFLVNLIYKIKKSLRDEINFYLKKSTPPHQKYWCGGKWDLENLFQNVEIQKGIKETRKEKKERKTRIKKPSIKLRELKDIFTQKEKIAPLVKKLKLNQDEIKTAQAIFHALINKSFLFFQLNARPVGFLLPAVYYASSTYKKVIVACSYTKKERLKKELLSIKKFAPFDFDFFEFKEPYFCLRKFNNFKKQNKFTLSELKFLIKIILWLNSYPHVNLDINLSGEERKLWLRFSHNPNDCLSRKCPFYPHTKDSGVRGYNKCLFYKAKERVKKAQIILVEHKTFLKNAFTQASKKFLPVFRDFIITEAQTIEDNASSVSTSSFSRQGEKNLWHLVSDIIANLEFILRLDSKVKIKKGLEVVKKEASNLGKKFDIFWGLWGMFWQERNKGKQSIYLNLDEGLRFGLSWNRIKETTSGIILRLGLLCGQLEVLIQKIKQLEFEEETLIILELYNFEKQIKEKISWLEDFILKKHLDENFIYWASFRNEGGEISLSKTPLEVKNLILKKLLVFKDNAILISPTLPYEKFIYLKERLGLFDTPTPFKMVKIDKKTKKQLPLIYIIENLPEPKKSNYQKRLLAWLSEFIKKSEGNSFVLFTSKEAIKKAHNDLLPLFDQLKIDVLSEDRAGIKRILENLMYKRKTQRYFILGRMSLLKRLTTLDLSLENFLITKLPFESLIYPVRSIRAAQFENGFKNHTLPRSIIHLKENLADFLSIASKNAKIYLLDTRIINKKYGLDFLKSLSDFNLIYEE